MKTPEQENIVCTNHTWFSYDAPAYAGGFTCETCGEDSFDPKLAKIAEIKPAPKPFFFPTGVVTMTEIVAPSIKGPTTSK